MGRVRSRRVLLPALMLAAALPARGEPLPLHEVPMPLAPWVDWVLWGHEQRLCPFLHGEGGRRVCAWPSRLELDLEDRGGRFAQDLLAQRPTWFPLPGQGPSWPQEVRLDGEPAVVVERTGGPAVRVPPGVHRVEGRFLWPALPRVLAVPPETGLLRLSLRGRVVAFPTRDERGRLWLERPAEEPRREESRLEVTVHRRVVDEIPLFLTTRVDLRVSGSSREVKLGPALPPGFVPLSLESPLPARVEPDGTLRVQVRAGRWTLSLGARHEGPTEALRLVAPPVGSEPPRWAAEEVWVFEARPHLRVVSVEGVALDPRQTTLPDEWKSLPAYRMGPGETLGLVEKRRGERDPSPDHLELARSWTLDFDGRGATVADRLSGEIRNATRLEMGHATALGRAEVNGVPQFLTRRAGSDRAGFEVPRGRIAVQADSRVEGGVGTLPAVGWDHDFAAVSARLAIPPGWRLLHARGVDRVEYTWLGRWTLLDLFVVLIVAMAVLRLYGRTWGALALLALGLTYTETGAPRELWVAVLVAEALHRAVPPGHFARAVGLARGAVLVVLVLAAVPFAVQQVRAGLFPALDRPPGFGPGTLREEYAAGMALVSSLAPREDQAPEALAAQAARPAEPSADSERAVGRQAPAADRPDPRYPDPKARITTGPGVPSWTWQTVRLVWSGPVERGQTMRLVWIPPGANRLLSLVRATLLGLLVLCVLGVGSRRSGRWLRSGGPAGPPAGGEAAAALLAVGLGLGAAGLFVPMPAAAELPPPQLLEQLRQRLLANPECHPSCAASPRLLLDAAPDRLVLRLEVDAAAETAVPLPGGAGSWVPERVLVDDAPASGLLRDVDGTLWVLLPPGRRQILLEGRLPPRESVELPLPLLPRHLEARVAGWELQGLHEDGAIEGTLQLLRPRENGADETAAALEPRALPPFVRVERELALGLEWQLRTRVERVSPAETAIVLEVPLLEGESVTTAGWQVRDRRVLVSLAPGKTRAVWTSLLEERETLSLAAPDAVPWTEVWRVDVSPLWHVEAEGIPSVRPPGGAGARVLEWRPWPGEQVTLHVERPAGIGGSTLTADAATLDLRPGLRATDATLGLLLRSSQGGQHAVRIPDGAQLEVVRVDGREQPVRQEGREVTLPLVPGTQRIELAWREPRGIEARFVAPQVDVGVPSVNVRVQIEVPPSRWPLWVHGPRLGPAVLFWPLLAVVAALAFLLGRVPLTPLRGIHWFLLGVGLTQVPVWAAGIVVAWLLALGWRARDGVRVPGRWLDLVQLGLVSLTLTALGVLFWSIERGLLGSPEMQIAGIASSADTLRWYQDRSDATLPRPFVLSAPLWVYRAAMLAWALWIAQALLRWLRWGWQCFTTGEMWRPLRPWRRARGGPAPGAGVR